MRNICAIICLLVIFTGCGGGAGAGAARNVAAPLPPDIDMRLSGGVRFTELKDGNILWDIRSSRADYSTESGFLSFEDVKAVYYRDGVPTYRVSGRSGAYDSRERTITLKGKVVGRAKNGYLMKTSSLSHNLDTDVAQTEDPVEILGDGLEISGVGMIADFRNETVKILDHAMVWAQPSKAAGGPTEGNGEQP